MSLKAFAARIFAARVNRKNRRWIQHPIQAQQKLFQRLIGEGARTQFGKDHDFQVIDSPRDFANRIPVRDYEDLKPYVNRILEGEADAVLSYTTSPAYHLIAEEDASKVAWAFDEGHYMQVEVAGKVASTDQPELADQFMAFMVTDAFQSVIPTTNWMYPAVTPEGGLPDGFETLVTPAASLLLSPEDAAATRDAALDEWRNALSQ